MKKLFITVFCLFAALAGTAAAAAAANDAPQIEKGWNLVSVPCDISVSDFKQKLGNDGFDVFTWDGSAYVAVEQMVRGKGYVLNNNAVLNPSSVCKEEVEAGDVTVELAAGWNLIGNPFHKAVTFSSAFGSAAGSITQIYESRGNKYVPVDKTDHIKPFRGYWVYAVDPVSITFVPEPDCDAVYVSTYPTDYYSNGQITVSYGKDTGFVLFASCFVNDEASSYPMYAKDITGDVEWIISDSAVVEHVSENNFTTLDTVGEAVITAEYMGMKSANSVKFTVRESNLYSLYIYPGAGYCDYDYNSYCLYVGESANIFAYAYYYNDWYSSEDVTSKVTWNVSDTSIASIDASGKLTGLAKGTVTVSAELEGIKSNEYVFTIKTVETVEPVVGPGGMKIAVTQAYYDDMGSILSNMGYVHSVLKPAQLSSPEVLSKFDAIFINCASGLKTIEAAQALKDFVNNGGELYMSDWAYIFLSKMFPESASFLGEVGNYGTTADAAITDAGLSAYMDGKTKTNIVYDLSGWVPIKSVSGDVTTYLTGNYSVYGNCSGSSGDDYSYNLTNCGPGPLMISLKYGEGRIVFTTFHNEANVSNDVKKILEYMALIPITGNLASANEEAIGGECDCGTQTDYLDTLDSGETRNVSISLTPDVENVIAVNGADGCDFVIEIYSPDGELYSSVNVGDNSEASLGRVAGRALFKTSSTGDDVALIKIPPGTAASGNWTYKIFGKNMPQSNTPLVVTIGEGK